MIHPVPGGHPDQDALADFAADALPPHQGQQVELHVRACTSCARLLADAERVRSLLKAPDPGPMPDDVWARVQAGLTTEATQQTRAIPVRGWFDTQTARPAASPSDPPPVNVPVPPPPQSMSFDEAPTAAWKAFLHEPEASRAESSGANQPRAGRAVRSMRTRRDVRTEDRGSRRWSRPVLLAGVAAAVAVLGLGAAGLTALIGQGRTADVSDALPGGGIESILHSSGTNYTASTLADQAKALVRAGSASAGGTAASSPARAAAPAPSAGTVSDPDQLAACLGALGEGDRRPLAVDLARYQNREAAVIVLPGTSGGLVVWVVARDCRPGVEGHLAYKAVPA